MLRLSTNNLCPWFHPCSLINPVGWTHCDEFHSTNESWTPKHSLPDESQLSEIPSDGVISIFTNSNHIKMKILSAQEETSSWPSSQELQDSVHLIVHAVANCTSNPAQPKELPGSPLSVPLPRNLILVQASEAFSKPLANSRAWSRAPASWTHAALVWKTWFLDPVSSMLTLFTERLSNT